MGKRPVARLDADRPWLEDEKKVRELMAALGPEVGLMFYLGNRSGLRPGEVCGLRTGDLDFLKEGVIRVAHSYGGPLKEDKRGEGIRSTQMPPSAFSAISITRSSSRNGTIGAIASRSASRRRDSASLGEI
jgi:integrase